MLISLDIFEILKLECLNLNYENTFINGVQTFEKEFINRFSKINP